MQTRKRFLYLTIRAMAPETADDNFYLSDVEVQTLRRAALERNLPFDPRRRTYSRHELSGYGMVREGYTREELRQLGFGAEAVSCFDERKGG